MSAIDPQAVPLLDLQAQYRTIAEEVRAALDRVIESQGFILGPDVAALEREIAEWIRVPHAIGCASGSDALLLALMALGLEPGDEVITTPYTFFATAGSIVRLGLRPVFCDIQPDSYNIDPAQIEARITERTQAILPVHLYGQMADMESILRIAEKHHLPVIEDAAQAIGAHHKGRRAGAAGTLGCLSFFPSKNLGAWGDAGLVTTADLLLADKIRSLRVHGAYERYFHKWVGLNSRLDSLQAAVLRVKLPHLNAWTEARRRNAARYRDLFEEAGLLQRGGDAAEPNQLIAPASVTDYHVYNQYVIRVHPKARDALIMYLKANHIGCAIYYPLPLHLQECFDGLGYEEGDFPEAERAARETIALPVYPELSEEQQRRVVSVIRSFYEARAARDRT